VPRVPTAQSFAYEWIVDAPVDAVFEAVADARTYPDWWIPTYRSVEAPGPAAPGVASTQIVRTRFPFAVRIRAEIVELDAPRLLRSRFEGGLGGEDAWTFTPRNGSTTVRWAGFASPEVPVVRRVGLLARLLVRVNARWAAKRAQDGLERYARARAGITRRRTLLTNLCAAMNRHDLDALAAFFTPDYHSEQPLHPAEAFEGREQLVRNWERIVAAVPDVQAELLGTAVEDDMVWSEWRFVGTKRDGNLLDARSVWIVRIPDDRIAWGRLYREQIVPADDEDAPGDAVDRLTGPEA
jgi:uncharacterized protein YndB with AHSA1/START domain/ketosteroid isomerase-like protein